MNMNEIMNTKVKGPTESAILQDIINVMSEGGDWSYDCSVYEEYARKKLEQLEHKKAHAQQKAAERKAEGDELGDAVRSVLNDELQIAEVVLEKLQEQYPDATLAKIRYRLRTLSGVVCEEVKVELDGKVKSRKAYRLAAIED